MIFSNQLLSLEIRGSLGQAFPGGAVRALHGRSPNATPTDFSAFWEVFFPVRAQAQGSLCVFSQPLGCSPRGPVGWSQRISFSTFKGKSSPSGIPTAVPGGVRYRSAASLEEYAFLHIGKSDDISRA
jgi:hypothetical protein